MCAPADPEEIGAIRLAGVDKECPRERGVPDQAIHGESQPLNLRLGEVKVVGIGDNLKDENITKKAIRKIREQKIE